MHNTFVFGAPVYREFCIQHDFGESTVKFYKPLAQVQQPPKKQTKSPEPKSKPAKKHKKPKKHQVTTQKSVNQNNVPEPSTKIPSASHQNPQSININNHSSPIYANFVYFSQFLIALYVFWL